MSLQLSAKPTIRGMASGIDEPWAPTRLGHGWSEPHRDQTPTFSLACRDVIDEIRLRMAVRGYSWE